MSGCELSLLSPIRPIEDEALIFHHVSREEEALSDVHHSIFTSCLGFCHMSLEVHRVHLISAVITPQMNV